jgi:membrane associated rhomboid family serine protease
MGEFIPDYLIREQAAVGALVIFGVLRVLAAVAALSRGWPIALVEKCAIGAAALYCAPQLIDVLTHSYIVHASSAELEGKVIGAAMALFFSPILSHRLGYE